jgi:hypothetical protein
VRSHPGTGWVVGVVAAALLIAAWPPGGEARPGATNAGAAAASSARSPWPVADSGLELTPSADWAEIRSGGVHALARDPARPLDGLLTASAEPDGDPASDGSSLDALGAAFGAAADLCAIDATASRDVAGLPAIRIDWRGPRVPGAPPRRGVTLICDRGASHLRIEVSAPAERWAGIAGDAEAMLATLRERPSP